MAPVPLTEATNSTGGCGMFATAGAVGTSDPGTTVLLEMTLLKQS